MDELEADELTLAIALSNGVWAGLAPSILNEIKVATPSAEPADIWSALSKCIASITAGHMMDLRAAIKNNLTCPGCGGGIGCTQEYRAAVQTVVGLLESNRVYLNEIDEHKLSEVKRLCL